jgi:hypothetical protein
MHDNQNKPDETDSSNTENVDTDYKPTEPIPATTKPAEIPADVIPLHMTTLTKYVKSKKIPKIIFIVPYRDRKQSLDMFKLQMKTILEDVPSDEYEIYISHQCDKREFNRGAIKNIGFLVIKNKYPDDYKKMTFVFNDVDTVPIQKNIFKYNTISGTVKHFYGFTYTLGGIVSITGEDFEKINGYLNLWSWGYEDNALQHRATNANLHIDRSIFFKINSKEILQEQHGKYRTVNPDDFDIYRNKINEGINSIYNIKYEITEDNFINIYGFDTGRNENASKSIIHDISKSNSPFSVKPKTNSRFKLFNV